MTYTKLKFTDEHRAKLRAAKLGIAKSPEHRAKIRESVTKSWGKRKLVVPDHLKTYANKLRRNHISGDDFRKAIEAAQGLS